MEHSAAKETLTKWLQAWVEKDWERMAGLTACLTDDIAGNAHLLAMNFRHRWAESYEEPIFKNGEEDAQANVVPFAWGLVRCPRPARGWRRD